MKYITRSTIMIKRLIKVLAKDIPVLKRPTYGCKIKNLVEDEYIIDVTII